MSLNLLQVQTSQPGRNKQYFVSVKHEDNALMLTDGEVTWEGRIVRVFLKSEGKEPPDATIKEYLLNESSDAFFQLETKDNKEILILKTKFEGGARRLAEISLEKQPEISLKENLIDILKRAVEERKQLLKELEDSDKKRKILLDQNAEYCKQLLGKATDREQVVTDLMKRFLPILNSKKEKIRELTAKLQMLKNGEEDVDDNKSEASLRHGFSEGEEEEEEKQEEEETQPSPIKSKKIKEIEKQKQKPANKANAVDEVNTEEVNSRKRTRKAQITEEKQKKTKELISPDKVRMQKEESIEQKIRKLESEGPPLPPGWKVVESRSNPGKLCYLGPDGTRQFGRPKYSPPLVQDQKSETTSSVSISKPNVSDGDAKNKVETKATRDSKTEEDDLKIRNLSFLKDFL